MARAVGDAGLSVSATLPNAANTATSNAIDLGQTSPWPVLEDVEVNVSVTTSTGANNKNVNIRLQHSDDTVNGNFTNLTYMANPVLRSVDVDNAGRAASNVTVKLGSDTKRYVRGVALGEANGGNAADGTFTVKLLV